MKAASPRTRTRIKQHARPLRTVDSSIDIAVSSKLRRSMPGTVFTHALFAGLGSRAVVDKALQRLIALPLQTTCACAASLLELPGADRSRWLGDLTLAPEWMQPTLRALASGCSPLGEVLIKRPVP